MIKGHTYETLQYYYTKVITPDGSPVYTSHANNLTGLYPNVTHQKIEEDVAKLEVLKPKPIVPEVPFPPPYSRVSPVVAKLKDVKTIYCEYPEEAYDYDLIGEMIKEQDREERKCRKYLVKPKKKIVRKTSGSYHATRPAIVDSKGDRMSSRAKDNPFSSSSSSSSFSSFSSSSFSLSTGR